MKQPILITSKNILDENRYRGISGNVELPEKTNVSKTAVRSQGKIGSCASQSSASIISQLKGFEVQARSIAIAGEHISGDEIEGTSMADIFDGIVLYGTVKEGRMSEEANDWEEYALDWSMFPGVESFINADIVPWRLGNHWGQLTFEDIKTPLAQGKQASIVVRWYKNFATGDFDFENRGKYVGLHAMVLNNYEQNGDIYEIKNSHGTGWGNGGYIKVNKNDLSMILVEAWVVTENSEDFEVDNYYGQKYKLADYIRQSLIQFKVNRKFNHKASRRELNALLNYWSYSEVFNGTAGDKWLHETKYKSYKNK